jgi:hypothetical protein
VGSAQIKITPYSVGSVRAWRRFIRKVPIVRIARRAANKLLRTADEHSIPSPLEKVGAPERKEK